MTAELEMQLVKMGWEFMGTIVGSRKVYKDKQGSFRIVTMDNGQFSYVIKSIGPGFSTKQDVEKSVLPTSVAWIC